MNKTPITLARYKAAADRIRRGTPQPGDEAVCDAYDRGIAPGPVMRTWRDLPMASSAWREAARSVER